MPSEPASTGAKKLSFEDVLRSRLEAFYAAGWRDRRARLQEQ